jgi:hypothetical protein
VVQAQPTQSQELPILLRAAAEQDQMVWVALAKREGGSVEMEMVVDRLHQVAEMQPQIQVQEVVAVAAIMGRCMAVRADQGL